jgi:hypothetical protein
VNKIQKTIGSLSFALGLAGLILTSLQVYQTHSRNLFVALLDDLTRPSLLESFTQQSSLILAASGLLFVLGLLILKSKKHGQKATKILLGLVSLFGFIGSALSLFGFLHKSALYYSNPTAYLTNIILWPTILLGIGLGSLWLLKKKVPK